MPTPLLRIVLDTTVLPGLVADESVATKILRAAGSAPILTSAQQAAHGRISCRPSDAELVERFPHLTPRRVEVAMRRLRFIGEYIRSPNRRFALPRDPRDEKLIELAIALGATHIVSDDRDLLDLPTSRAAVGRRFRQLLPRVQVLSAGELLRSHAKWLKVNRSAPGTPRRRHRQR